MISIHCSDERYLSRLTSALRGMEVVRAGSWDEMPRRAAGCSCSLVVLEWLLNARELDELCRFRQLLPLHPIVLVTRDDADNARCLAGLAVDEVLWIREIEQRLTAAVGRARAKRRVSRLAAEIEKAQRLPPRLRMALCAACLAPRPPRSVARLASLAGCHRSTLWLQWRQAVEDAPDLPVLRLEDFLDWLLLLSAVERKSPRLKWTEVARDVGVHEHTLSRLARRLAGLTLGGLENGGGVALLDQFTSRVLPRVLGTAPHGAAPQPRTPDALPALAGA